ncbi:hypothetical protein [Thermogymnomonas acidicola]|uniref:hypothetical protein n=1 Tax=Thermogymnomonas acidicola TaxID=399579 RepID=UPI001667CDBB|nr:hypothetical protein [Thermogymnomonas acidicola]
MKYEQSFGLSGSLVFVAILLATFLYPPVDPVIRVQPFPGLVGAIHMAVFPVIGIFASALANTMRTHAGAIMITLSVLGLDIFPGLYILSFALILIGGMVAVLR